jgi:hypothetical protein
LGFQTAECTICKNHDPCGTGVLGFCKVAIGGLIAILQNFRYKRLFKWTFGGNRANRRPISSKDVAVYGSTG